MWTDQTVETLKKLALEGRSAAWIAAALGAPSRSAVIGKANRIGIKLNGGMHSGDGARLDPPRPLTPWGGAHAQVLDKGLRSERSTPADLARRRAAARARSLVPAGGREARRSDRRLFATAEVGEMRRIGFADIGEAQCRWPLGDPMLEDFAYCGLQIVRGHAYCAGHCRLVYRPQNA